MDQDEVVIIGADGTEHVFPAGFDPKKAAEIVRTGSGIALAPSHGHEPSPAPIVGGGGRGTGFDPRQAKQNFGIAAPMIGGATGGLLGGPAGAALGGMAGQAVQAASEDRGPGAGELLKAGTINAATEAVGPIASKALAKTGSGLYRAGVALLPRTLKQQYPNIAETGIEEGLALTRRGATEAGKRATASRQSVDATIAAAEQAGAGPVSTRRIITELRPVRDKLADRVQLGMADETGAVSQRARMFASHNKGGIPLTRAQELKREAQDLAESAYRAQERGGTVNGTDLLLNEAQARGLRQEIERLVPEAGPMNARTQALMGLEKAAEHASGTGHVLSRVGGAAAGGSLGGVQGAVAGLLATTPGGLTSVGTGLGRMAPVASHLPTALRLSALLAALSEQNGQ